MKIEVTAKKVQDAINQGLKQLGATLDEVEVKVIDQGGLFRKAKIEMTIDRGETPVAENKKPETEQPAADSRRAVEQPASSKPQPEKTATAAKPQRDNKRRDPDNVGEKRADKKPAPEKRAEKPLATEGKAEENAAAPSGLDRKPRKLNASEKEAAAHALEFVRTVIEKMGFDAKVEAKENCEYTDIAAEGGDDNLIIGRRGETLAALSYLAETCARAEKAHISIVVDCNGYRDRRAEKLVAEAKRRADECVQRRRKVRLEPMERSDRRTVHNALSSDPRVTTASEGKEPHRYIVITPKNNNNN